MTTVVSNDEVIIVYDDACINLTCQEPSWVIDLAASYHVTSQRVFFSSYSKGDFGHVRMENDMVAKIVGMKDVCLETNTGCRLLLRNIRHVPDIRLHLIFVCDLDDDGYSSQFVEEKWKLTKGSLVVAKGKKTSLLTFLILMIPKH